jgi:hypothetical protein
MSSHQRFGIILAGTLLVSVAPMKMTPAQQQPAPARTKTVGSYAEAKTLSNALPLLKQQIADDHKMSSTLKKQLAPLLTEQAVKQKIRSALSDYEAKITEAEEKTYFQKTIAPVYQRIAQTGKLSRGRPSGTSPGWKAQMALRNKVSACAWKSRRRVQNTRALPCLSLISGNLRATKAGRIVQTTRQATRLNQRLHRTRQRQRKQGPPCFRAGLSRGCRRRQGVSVAVSGTWTGAPVAAISTQMPLSNISQRRAFRPAA